MHFVFSISSLHNKSYEKSNDSTISSWKLNFLSNIILLHLIKVRFHLRKFLVLKICQGIKNWKFCISSYYLSKLNCILFLIHVNFLCSSVMYICCLYFLEWLLFPFSAWKTPTCSIFLTSQPVSSVLFILISCTLHNSYSVVGTL